MIVYVCNKCNKKYDEKIYYQSEKCPICHSYLKMQVADSKTEYGKKEVEDHDSGGEKSSMVVKRRTTGDNADSGDDVKRGFEHKPFVKRKKEEEPAEENVVEDKNKQKQEENKNCLEGKIISAVSDTNFKRYFWTKLYDKFFLKQHVNDILNTVIVRCKDSNGREHDERVIWYGVTKGGIGELRTGMDFRAEGRFNKNNEFIAYKIVTDQKAVVSVKNECMDVVYLFIPLLVAVLLLYSKNIMTILNSVNLCKILYGFFVPVILSISGMFWLLRKTRRTFFQKCKWGILLGIILNIILLAM